MAVVQHEVSVPARDGLSLAGTWFAPPSGMPVRATLVVASATGVRRSFYAPFAQAMAEVGLRTLTFDYRGVGDSAPATLRGFAATMQEWAEQDLDGALDFTEEHWPDEPMLYLGHSFGGQALGLLRRAAQVRAAVFVGSQSGYWRLWRGWSRWRIFLLWFLVIPLLTRLFGYLPGRRLGLGASLPLGVAQQWAQWGRHPAYLLSAGSDVPARFAAVSIPIRAYSAWDDTFAPKQSAAALLTAYGGASVEHRHLGPNDVVGGQMGHFGFFRDTHRVTLWTEIAAWLLDHC